MAPPSPRPGADPIPAVVRSFASEPCHGNAEEYNQTLDWMRREATRESILQVPAPAGHPFWEMAARAPKHCQSPELLARVFQTHGWIQYLRGDEVLAPLPRIENLADVVQARLEAASISGSAEFTSALRRYVQAQGPALEPEELARAVELARQTRAPRQVLEWLNARRGYQEARMNLVQGLAQLPDLTPEQVSALVHSFARTRGWEWSFQTSTPEETKRWTMSALYAHPSFRLQTALGLARSRHTESWALSALARIPRLRQHPKIRAALHGLSFEPDVAFHLALEATPQELTGLWSVLVKEAPGFAVRLLEERTEPLSLSSREVAPLLATSDPRLRLRAIAALPRHQGSPRQPSLTLSAVPPCR